MTRIVGILNITADSFSDGGRYLSPDAAIAHASALLDDGADIIDLGAESTHPDAADVSAGVEIERLTPVVRGLVEMGAAVSVDTYKPAVMRRVIELGATMINDVTGVADPEARSVLCDSDASVVVMHSRSPEARARRDESASTGGREVDGIVAYFQRRLGVLEDAGIARERLIVDPGMGFFLSSDAEASLAVLRGLERFRVLGCPVYVSMSRKSFIGQVLGRPVDERGPGTLTTEVWAMLHGVGYIRTHDVRAAVDARRMLAAIRGGDDGGEAGHH
jgi:dihydropteroate synthase